ncbi:hypothetical protein MLD38_040197 [Melastoma candidum]|uniref:Uncharacterized protein n=1 Tax=Melastoma candidum TaxID=119954 RepID=A0ACB9L4Y4_9MYRT|nr:hypothetical protein MLD38_040197 [Melastoma candidum]
MERTVLKSPERTLPKSPPKDLTLRYAKEEGRDIGPKPRTPKPVTKENTKPVDVKLHTQQRAAKRAIFNYTVATKLFLTEQQKKQEEKLRKMLEEEEVRMLRKEMIPRAQLMPLFDRPFLPQRSSRPLTVPREPGLGLTNSKSWTCAVPYNHLGIHGCYAFKAIK